MEGTFVRNYNPCRPEPLTDPILEYAHSVAGTDNCSVTGGYRYRGPIPGLGGSYVYGDYCSGRLWIATETGASWSTAEWSEIGFGLTSFGEDDDGRLYVIDGSTVKRFTSPSSVFGDGFEFADTSPWSAAVGGS